MTLATGRSVSRCFSLFVVPEGGTEAGRSLRERRDRRLVHSLLTGTGAVTADALHPLVSRWLSGRSRIVAARAFLVELNWCLQSESACGRAAPCEARALCCERAQRCERVFTKRGAEREAAGSKPAHHQPGSFALSSVQGPGGAESFLECSLVSCKDTPDVA